MTYVLDTSVVIQLRDRHADVRAQVAALQGALLLSVVTAIELESGVYRDSSQTSVRRQRLDAILQTFPVLPFDRGSVAAYGSIVQAVGYSRRKLLDRMIAAQALLNMATVVTLNPDDFKDVPGLSVLAW